jgi:hypothetical protein
MAILTVSKLFVQGPGGREKSTTSKRIFFRDRNLTETREVDEKDKANLRPLRANAVFIRGIANPYLRTSFHSQLTSIRM